MKEYDNINKVTKTEGNQQLTQNESEPLYVISLEFEKGQKKNIPIYSDSNPAELAFEFCKENNLDFSSLNCLTIEIENMIKKLTTQIISITEPKIKEKEDIQPEEINEQPLTSIDQREENCFTDKESEKIEKMIDDFTKTKNQSLLNNMTINTSCLSIQKKLSLAQLKYNPKLFSYEFEHGNNSSKKNQSRKRRGIQFNKSISSVKPTQSMGNTSRISSCTSFSNQPQTIYEKLFKEASYNKVIIKRKCHFSKTKTPYSHVNTTSSQSSITFDGCNTNPNYIRNFISTENIKPECTFKPKISVYQSTESSLKSRNIIIKNNRNLISSNEVIQFNKSFRKGTQANSKPKKIATNNSTIDNTHGKQLNVYNTINIISSANATIGNNSKNKHYQSNSNPIVPNYLPLRERSCCSIKSNEDNYLENIRKDAFENLFDELFLRNKGNILNKNTMTIQKTSKTILGYIDPIITSITNENKDFTKEEFVAIMKNLFHVLSLEGKRTIIRNYHNSTSMTEPNKIKSQIIVNQGDEKKDKISYFNTKTVVRNKPNIIERRNHGKSLDFAIDSQLKIKKEKQRNFYYVFEK